MAFEKQDIDLNFPLLGVDRRVSAKGSPPGTSVNAVNVRMDDSSEGRVRGGSRPGTIKAYNELLGSGTKIQHLGQLNRSGDGQLINTTAFWSGIDPSGSISGNASAYKNTDPPYYGVLDTSNPVSFADDLLVGGFLAEGYGGDDYYPLDPDTGGIHGASIVLAPTPGLDINAPYSMEFILHGATLGLNSQIWFRIPADWEGWVSDEDIPDPGDHASVHGPNSPRSGPDGVYLQINSINNVGAGNVSITQTYLYSQLDHDRTTVDSNTNTFTTTDPITVLITVDNNDVVIKINGDTRHTETLPETNVTQPGTRIGLEIREESAFPPAVPGPPLGGFESVKVIYTSTLNPKPLNRNLIAVANGALWVEDNTGTMILDTGPATLNTDVLLQGIDHLSKYYIADYGDIKAEETDATIDATGKIVKIIGVDLTGEGIDPDNHVIELFDVTGGVAPLKTIAGMYTIKATDGVVLNGSDTDITLDVSCTDGSTTGGASIRIGRGPKVYAPIASPGSRLTNFVNTTISTKGSPPFGCASVVRYNDRLSFAVDIFHPHLWYQSRQGDPEDFNYFPVENDVQRAVAGQSSEAGGIGDQIISQIVHSDDYMIYGSPSSMWVLRGDPSYGGRLDNISRSVGISGRDAYCFGPEGQLIFLTPDGIYTNERGVAEPIQSVSREKLPRELLDIDSDAHHISVVYDVMERGIHFMVSGIITGTKSFHYFVSWPFKGFMPVDFADGHDPFALWDYNGSTVSARGTLIGCRDGYIRQHTFAVSKDDSSSVKSMATLGPIYLGNGPTAEGILKTLSVDLDESSADVKATIIVGKNHAQAMDRSNAYFEETIGSVAGNNTATGDNPNIPWVSTYARAVYTLAAGVNNLRPNVRGTSLVVILENADNTTYWALEDVQGVSVNTGRRR